MAIDWNKPVQTRVGQISTALAQRVTLGEGS